MTDDQKNKAEGYIRHSNHNPSDYRYFPHGELSQYPKNDPLDVYAKRMARNKLMNEEGFRSLVYKCSAGANTIGFGRNLDAKGVGIEEATILLNNDIEDAFNYLKHWPFWRNLTAIQKTVLADMYYNLGSTGLHKFVKMIEALRIGDYNEASVQMLDSNYAKQLPERSARNAILIKEGK